MPEINILSPHVADLIAAGEVVERPASVIKELVENSIDAGAKNITVELKDGGLTYIRVTDDGQGMLPEDAGVCFLRHATSKLADEKGLERIGTMGFRGEALAAISSVSQIGLLTRKRGVQSGTRMLVQAGDIIEMTDYGCPEGTTMIVRNLFQNTPARLKFMKSDRAESSACVAAALRCALGRPEISLRLIRDGKDEFFSPGDGKQSSCVYSLLGREIATNMLNCALNDEETSVSGFVSTPATGHGNRAKQFFFCNGRCIRSALLQSAVEQAYKNTLLTGRFPACVIWLDISPAAVDVNVHPAKIEVKFREERRVFDAVYYAVLSALKEDGQTPEIKLAPSTQAAIAPKKDFFQSMSSRQFRDRHTDRNYSVPKQSIDENTIIIDRRPPAEGSSTLRDGRSAYISGPSPASFMPRQEEIPSAPAAPTEPAVSEPQTETAGEQSFRLVGEAMKTYIIVEADDTLLLIDKHAAHERMIFNALKAQDRQVMSQTLLEPVTLKMSPHDVELVEKNAELLSTLGIELEPFGDDSLILRALPADTDASDGPALIEELCEKLRRGTADIPSVTDEILHTIACKAAIKAGWKTTPAELNDIARRVVSGEVRYCPHGRPVSVKLTKKQLDKEFSRIV